MFNTRQCRWGLGLVIGILGLTVWPASGQAGLKGKIQERLNSESSNIQYEPYYLDANANEGDAFGNTAVPNDNKAPAIRNNCLASGQPSPADEQFSRYAIYQSDYKAEIEENVVTVSGRVVFQVFAKGGWTQIPLVKADVGLLDVSVNRGVAFVTMRGNQYYLMVDKPGRYTLNLEFLIKAARERENGPGSFRFDMMPAPISQFEYTMPETGVEIFVDPAIKVEVKQEAGRTVAWAVMPNTQSISARWTKALPKEDLPKVQLEPKVYVDTATYAAIGEGVIRCRTRLTYSILQAEIPHLRVALPADVSVLQVEGRELRDWKVSTEQDRQYLDIYFNFGLKGQYELALVYERNVGEGSVVAELPVIRALGVERENGYLGVAARTNVELAVNKAEHVTAIDVKELPASIWGSSSNPLLLAFKYLNHPYSVSIDVTRHEELPVLVAAIDTADYVTLGTREGKVLTKATYQVRNNVKQFLRLVLPEGAELWSSFIAGKPVKPARDKEGHVLIPLEKSQLQGETLTRFPVEIVYLSKGPDMGTAGRLRFTLPRADIPVSSLQWDVYLPDDWRYFRFGGDVQPGGVYGRGRMDGGRGRQVRREMAQVGGEMVSQKATYASQYWGGKDDMQMAAPMAAQEDTRMGVLPIKIDIPQQGRHLRFSKLLVTEAEAPVLTARYLKVPRFLGGALRLLVGLGMFAAAGLLIRRLFRRKPAAS